MKRGRQNWNERQLAEYLEDAASAITHSTNGYSISSALQKIVGLDQPVLMQVLDTIAPAALVSMILRGYELPDAQARLESNKALVQLASQFKALHIGANTTEQFWLILAQQQEVILELIEDDLEALQDSALNPSSTKERTQILSATHKLIRTQASSAVQSLFSVGGLSAVQRVA